VIRNQSTAVERSVVSDTAGGYLAPSLPPGPYRVEAQLSGFQDQARDVDVEVARTAVVNIRLTVGAVAFLLISVGTIPTLWFASLLVGRSILGIQAGDLVKLANILKKENNIKEIYGVAKKEMSPLLLHAAAFDKDIKKVALLEPYSSYRSIVMSPLYEADFLHSTVPGAIGVYDLPDLAASLAPGKLLMVGVTDGNGDNTNTADINKDLSVIKTAYQIKNATGELQIEPALSAGKLSDALKKWLEN